MIEKLKKNHFFYAAAFLLAVMPVDFLVAPAIVVLVISWSFHSSIQQKTNHFRQNALKVSLLSLPFLVYLAGMLNSENQSFGWMDIEIKFSMVLFPLILGTARAFTVQEKRQLLRYFIYSMTICGLISAAYGFNKYGSIPTYTRFNLLLHPGYMAMYANFALIAILNQFNQTKGLHKTFLTIAFVLLSATVCLTLSKLGLIFWGILILFVVIYNVFIVKSKFLVMVAIAILATLMIFSAYKFLPELSQRFYWANQALEGENKVDISTTESTQVRILIWGESWDLLKENLWFGTGTGDIKDELLLKYEKAGMTGALEKRLNVHNQFLQVLTALGLIGFSFFMIGFLYPLFLALRSKQYLYLFFMILIATNFFVESMLEKQDGVVFYAFLNSFLFFSSKSGKENRLNS